MKQLRVRMTKLLFYFLALIAIGLVTISLLSQHLLLPNTYIDNINVGWYTPTQAYKKIASIIPASPAYPIELRLDNNSQLVTSAQLGIFLDINSSIDQAMLDQNQLSWAKRLGYLVKALKSQKEYQSTLKLDTTLTTDLLSVLGEKLHQPALPAKYIYKPPKELGLDLGNPGLSVSVEETASAIEDALNSVYKDPQDVQRSPLNPIQVEWRAHPIHATLTQEVQAVAIDRAAQYLGKKIEFVSNTNRLTLTVTDEEIIAMLNPSGGVYPDELDKLIQRWSIQLDRPPSNAEFEYDPQSLVVTKFQPAKPGIALNQQKLEQLLLEQLDLDQPTASLPLPIEEAPPLIQLADTNSLGINQEIGFGESYFAHSIPSRVHNVGIASDKVQNVIIPPGAEFSFVKTLGEVSKATGYQPAYIIRSGRTELGDGGGVCQVSTTLFRAVLSAGLQVTKRLPHSYRVSYYELDSKPGVDATVYTGEVDLRFVNDTPGHILLHSWVDKDSLYMNYTIYGTSDGRTAEIIDHQVWGYQPPPPNQEIVDPSLPPGSRKQIDWAAPGIKAKFTNVIKNQQGEVTRQDEYYSNYRPWSAKFLVGPTP